MMDEDAEDWIEVESTVCQACAALDRHQKDSKEPEPGEYMWVRDFRRFPDSDEG